LPDYKLSKQYFWWEDLTHPRTGWLSNFPEPIPNPTQGFHHFDVILTEAEGLLRVFIILMSS
jgi:hypothetical protein